MHVAGLAGDIQRLAAIVALDDGDHFRRHFVLVHQAADAQRCLEAESDLGLHVGELLLVKLHAGQRLAELLAVETILQGAEPAIFGSTHHTPGNAVTGAVEAAEWAFQAGNIGQQRVFADFHAIHDDFARNGGAQRKLAADFRG
ncbi:hypothetical protein D3C87_1183700 [compost metagenome]